MTETERLILKPLTYGQLQKYVKNDHTLEAELNLEKNKRIIAPELKEALEQIILPNVANPRKNYLYSTLWTIISKADNRMTGDLCFMGEPNADGEIELGYGTYEEFQNKGFMTEAVGGIIQWAEKQPNVISVVASTSKENVASFSVLQKNNFVKTGESDTLFHWKLPVKNIKGKTE